MAQTFNSPWVGALAADLATPGQDGRLRDAPAQPRWDVADHLADHAWSLLADDQLDGVHRGSEALPGDDHPAEAELQAAARDVSVYQIGFTVLIGVGIAVGLSTAMLLR